MLLAMWAGISLASIVDVADVTPFFLRRIIRGARLEVRALAAVEDGLPPLPSLGGGGDWSATAAMLMDVLPIFIRVWL